MCHKPRKRNHIENTNCGSGPKIVGRAPRLLKKKSPCPAKMRQVGCLIFGCSPRKGGACHGHMTEGLGSDKPGRTSRISGRVRTEGLQKLQELDLPVLNANVLKQDMLRLPRRSSKARRWGNGSEFFKATIPCHGEVPFNNGP